MKTTRSLTFVSVVTLVALAGCQQNSKPQTASPALPPANVEPTNSPAKSAAMRPARELITSSPLDIDPKATFAEFSQRFAQARKDQKVLPDGSVELDRLYDLVVSPGFQGATDSEEVVEQLDRWVKENPEDPTPRIARIRERFNAASVLRKAERYQWILKDLHAQTREVLPKAADDPEVYRLLLETDFVELSASPQRLKTIIDDAVRAGPKYYPLYDAIAKIVVDVKGQCPLLAQLAREAVAAYPSDDGFEPSARGLEICTRIALAANRADRRALLISGFDLKTLNAGAKVLLKRYPQAAELVDFIGVVAYVTDDVELAREVLPELKSRKPNLADWGDDWSWQRFQQFARFTPLIDQPEQVFWPGPRGTSSMVFADRGRQVLATAIEGEANSLWLWTLSTESLDPEKTLPQRIQINEGRLGKQLAADRQGERLLSFDAARTTARIFDLTQGSVPDNLTHSRLLRPTIQPFADEKRSRPERNSFEISEDGTVAMAFIAGQVELFAAATGASQTHFTTPGFHTLENAARHLSPDGKWLALRGQQSVEIWDCVQGKKHSEISDAVIKSDYLMAFGGLLPDQIALLATRQKSTGQSEVTLSSWDFLNQKLTPIGPIHHRDLPIAILGNDLVACFTPTIPPLVHVYQIKDGKRIRSLQAHFAPQISARFSPDGNWLATWEFQGPVKLWKLTPDH